jgi:hypothetical protein
LQSKFGYFFTSYQKVIEITTLSLKTCSGFQKRPRRERNVFKEKDVEGGISGSGKIHGKGSASQERLPIEDVLKCIG